MRASLVAAALVLLTSSPGLAVESGMARQGRKLRATGRAGRALRYVCVLTGSPHVEGICVRP